MLQAEGCAIWTSDLISGKLNVCAMLGGQEASADTKKNKHLDFLQAESDTVFAYSGEKILYK